MRLRIKNTLLFCIFGIYCFSSPPVKAEEPALPEDQVPCICALLPALGYGYYLNLTHLETGALLGSWYTNKAEGYAFLNTRQKCLDLMEQAPECK